MAASNLTAVRFGSLDTVPARVGNDDLVLSIETLARIRKASRPLHLRGEYVNGTITRFGSVATGTSWLEGTGPVEATIRISRAIGFPKGWPDIQGIAARIRSGGKDADVLSATTGLGRTSRFLLTVATATAQRAYTTLPHYRGPRGPVVLGVPPRDADSFELRRAEGLGQFDPVLLPLPELTPHPRLRALRALRAPAYRTARRSRSIGTTETIATDIFRGCA
jgi:hypothetical protein